MVGSGTSLLGLIKHLTRVEIAWFQYAFAGADVQVPGDDLAGDDDLQPVIGAYQAAVAVSNRDRRGSFGSLPARETQGHGARAHVAAMDPRAHD